MEHRAKSLAQELVRYRANRAAILEQKRARMLRQRYGLSVAEYDALAKKQRGRCAICGTKPNERRLSVDHDHASGRVRGLLCYSCNYRLGHLETKWFRVAMEYLGKS